MTNTTEKVRVILLGSTGSIGTQALDIARKHANKVQIVGLTAHSNWKLLRDQVYEFDPEFAVLTDPTVKSGFQSVAACTHTKFYYNIEEMLKLIRDTEADVVLNSLVGFSGFLPTLTALESEKRVALANKESLVVGGELLKEYLHPMSPRIFPIDSEHSAIFQSLVGEPINRVEKLVITASGGPFRTYSVADLDGVTVESALKHPNWSMGSKITIDSATMMNKGLEVIEAKWLFDLPLDRIEAVIHPQSIIHSMATFVDGSTKAQLGVPDMRVPIQYALSYPDRWASDVPRINWNLGQQWTFEPVDLEKFPCFNLARRAVEFGGTAPVVLNASNEIAVERFLNKEIPYIGISKVVSESLDFISGDNQISRESILDIDQKTRDFAKKVRV